MTKYYRVQLIRSLIGTPKSTKNVANSLNLSKISSYTYVPVTPGSAGNVLKLRNLVDVKLYNFDDESALKSHIRLEIDNRKAEDGFTIIKSS